MEGVPQKAPQNKGVISPQIVVFPHRIKEVFKFSKERLPSSQPHMGLITLQYVLMSCFYYASILTIFLIFKFFDFFIQLTFSSILYWFQVYSTVDGQLHNLRGNSLR